MVLFFAVIHKIREKKLFSKTIKYKLDCSSKMQFAFFYPKKIQKSFWENYQFVENQEMKQIAWGGGPQTSVKIKIYVNFFSEPWIGGTGRINLKISKLKNNSHKQSPEVFCKKGALKSFANFTRKHLCWSFILMKM